MGTFTLEKCNISSPQEDLPPLVIEEEKQESGSQ